MDANTLRAFSQCLLRLSVVAESASPERLVTEALGILRGLIPFHAAWWGECAMDGQGAGLRNWVHGCIDLPLGFAQEWAHVAAEDEFAHESVGQLGMVVRAQDDEPPGSPIWHFVQRHGLHHAMAITEEMPENGPPFFLVLYRSRPSSGFSDLEALCFEAFSRHLLHHWHRRIERQMQASRLRSAAAFGLLDGQGRLLYLGRRLGALLQRQHPDWRGGLLPPRLGARLHGVAQSQVLGRHRLMLQPFGDLTTLTLEAEAQALSLSPREQRTAQLYAQGRSAKEIARELGLTPATVRTYLRQAYQVLGVHNKVELGTVLSASQSGA